MYEHPAVREAAAVGVPDEAMGEEVGAAIVLKRSVKSAKANSARLAQPSPTAT